MRFIYFTITMLLACLVLVSSTMAFNEIDENFNACREKMMSHSAIKLTEKDIENICTVSKYTNMKVIANEDNFALLKKQIRSQLTNISKNNISKNNIKTFEKPLRQKINEVKNNVEKKIIQKRIIKENVLMDINDKYREAINKYNNLKSTIPLEQKNIKNQIANEKKCLDDDKNDCKALEKKTIDMIKKHLFVLTDVMNNSIERIKLRIEGSDILSEDEVEILLDDIVRYNSIIDELNIKIINTGTKKDVKLVWAEVMSSWKDIRSELNLQAELISRNDMRIVAQRLDSIEENMLVMIEKIEEEDGNVSEKISLMVENLITTVKSGRDHLGEYDYLIENHGNMSKSDLSIKLKEYRKAANDDFMKANKILMDIVFEVKNMNSNVDPVKHMREYKRVAPNMNKLKGSVVTKNSNNELNSRKQLRKEQYEKEVDSVV